MMKKITILYLLILSSISGFAQNQLNNDDIRDKAVVDSISLFYKALFQAFKSRYIHRKSIDWKKVEAETDQHLQQYDSFKSSLAEITVLFDQLNATHCLVYRGDQKYTLTKKIIPPNRYSAEWKRKYELKPSFEIKLIDGKYGYILIPGLVTFDQSEENLQKIAQPWYNQIADFKNRYPVEGWIIDLRFNTGGNSTPMLLALHDFFGNQHLWGELDENKKMVGKFNFKDGIYRQNNNKIASIKTGGKLLDEAKVVVITGIFTGSSGEVTALAFKGRSNTTFVGENTAGFTTGNITFPLPFDTILALTTDYDSDRNGIYYPYLVPDVAVSRQDNFENLLDDGNIKEGIKFFKGTHE